MNYVEATNANFDLFPFRVISKELHTKDDITWAFDTEEWCKIYSFYDGSRLSMDTYAIFARRSFQDGIRCRPLQIKVGTSFFRRLSIQKILRHFRELVVNYLAAQQ